MNNELENYDDIKWLDLLVGIPFMLITNLLNLIDYITGDNYS